MVVDHCYFDSYGCSPSVKVLDHVSQTDKGKCSEYQTYINKTVRKNCHFSQFDMKQKNDNYCAPYCLYVLYLTRILQICFTKAISNLY